MVFKDRESAGKDLAEKLENLHLTGPIVLALARGGMPVGFEIAKKLNALLDVVVARKITLPGFDEVAIGAVAEGGTLVLDEPIIRSLGLNSSYLLKLIEGAERETERRVNLYRKGRKLSDIRGKCVILVDDGLATGMTAKATVKMVSEKGAERVIFASPVCEGETADDLRTQAHQVVCIVRPANFMAVGEWYGNFTQVTDEQVIELLNRVLR